MSMTPRERLLTVLKGGIPDCVPVAPDFSNMIPARLTGKPFWDLYLYNDPPIWEAYIECAKYFNIDSLLDGYFQLEFPEEDSAADPELDTFIIFKDDERIITQRSYIEKRRRIWEPLVKVYRANDPPSALIPPGKIGLKNIPEKWEPLFGVKSVDRGPSGLKRVRKLMGDQGLVGVSLTSSCALKNEKDVYRYYDNPDKHDRWARQRVEEVEKRFEKIMALNVKQDFFCVGGSGSLVFQTEEIFRQLAFPAVKRAIELASKAGIPTHVHSCGPEKALVKILAEETELTVIDPLEIPPMGDCNLAELKRLYGSKILLKGNLHTTDIMLNGNVEDVINASKKAIDDAGENGGFILSTGDQCGRDTPDENIHAMVETARTYGKY